MAARGALRIGAGLVTLAPPPEALAENAARLDAIMLRALPDATALADLLQDTRFTALCLGPGLGLQRAQALVPLACRSGRAVVLDADAFSAYGGAPAALTDLCHARCVLTPHDGEFARIFPDLAAAPAVAREDRVREAARRSGAVVLLKGPDSLIACPAGRLAVNRATGAKAAPWLATAGSGDVLAGFIAGLLARGADPFDAACSGAWLHAEAARRFGPGLIAEDLPDELPGLFRTLGV
ncbi:ADP/ATP-dependent (S)-NAD(P)H-hydrate dehydratase [Szabonella alba]|uniref:ADP-dependent NAD(P)H-hydrate dehydratase n=1 Tax=Szabonella alba TaxID=2804194 RepID=UPI0030802D2D